MSALPPYLDSVPSPRTREEFDQASSMKINFTLLFLVIALIHTHSEFDTHTSKLLTNLHHLVKALQDVLLSPDHWLVHKGLAVWIEPGHLHGVQEAAHSGSAEHLAVARVFASNSGNTDKNQ